MVSYEKLQKRLALRQFGCGANPRWLINVMREYDKPAYNPRSQQFPDGLSEITETKLSHVHKGDYHTDHKFFPRVKCTFSQLKPHGWKSEWTFGHQTKRYDIYVIRAIQKGRITIDKELAEKFSKELEARIKVETERK